MVRKRRFAQVSTSESDDDDRPRTGRSSRRKKVLRDDDDDGRREEEEEEEMEMEMEVKDGIRSKRRGGGEEKKADKGKEVEEEEVEQALPIGEPVRFSGKGRKRKKHYASFEHEGNVFELNNALLAKRLLNKELEPVVILNMSPNELMDGLTAGEKVTKEPEESEHMQMTDARCTIFMEKRAAVTDIIHVGGHGNRYQMDKKQNKGGRGMNQRTGRGTTLREENIGKKRVDVSSMLWMEHLQKLAMWAGFEAGIPPLGALFGHRLASRAEAEGVPLGPSIFVCHKCESILKPGSNCTVRIEKNVKKGKQRNKSHVPSQNNVVYKCHLCSHHNILRGTQRGYVKTLLPLKPRPETSSKAEFSPDKAMKPEDEKKLDLKNVGGKVPLDVGPLKLDAFITPEVSVEKSSLPLLERLANSSKKKRKSIGFSANKAASETGSRSIILNFDGGSNKRKRKGWSSLKKITENNEAQSSQSLSCYAIPFLLQAGK